MSNTVITKAEGDALREEYDYDKAVSVANIIWSEQCQVARASACVLDFDRWAERYHLSRAEFADAWSLFRELQKESYPI